jgi:diaminopimelate epimerase
LRHKNRAITIWDYEHIILQKFPEIHKVKCLNHSKTEIKNDKEVNSFLSPGNVMDYRNADGSVSEMCGNGVRVFARYLADHQGVDTSRPLAIGTRAGIKTVVFEADGRVTADMGKPTLQGETKVGVGERSWPAVNVGMGNPHAVAFVDSLDDAGPLLESPSYDPATYPAGVNVEFVVRRAPRHVAMRVHERGSGETRSCGTGACAVMVASALADGTGRGTTYRVDVPGGELAVTWTDDDHLLLTGPAVLVAEGDVLRP